MTELPLAVRELLDRELLERRHPAWLQVDREGLLIAAGGALERYGLAELEAGSDVGSEVAFLVGFLPCEGSAETFPGLEAAPGRFADVSLVPSVDGAWVIVLDATEALEQQLQFQQKTNDLSLLRHRHAKMLDQYLGREIVAKIGEDVLGFDADGERRQVTVLFGDIRGFTRFSERVAPERVFVRLNIYLRPMIEAVLEQAGIVDKLIGDAIMAIFGVLPSSVPAPEQAVRAALRMLEAVRELAATEQEVGLEIGVGVATGPVVLGILGSKERRSFTAIGHHVNLAARLEGQARRSEILLDADTHAALGPQLGGLFLATEMTLKGIHDPVNVFSLAFPVAGKPSSESRNGAG